jgi:hypothetical protein
MKLFIRIILEIYAWLSIPVAVLGVWQIFAPFENAELSSALLYLFFASFALGTILTFIYLGVKKWGKNNSYFISRIAVWVTGLFSVGLIALLIFAGIQVFKQLSNNEDGNYTAPSNKRKLQNDLGHNVGDAELNEYGQISKMQYDNDRYKDEVRINQQYDLGDKIEILDHDGNRHTIKKD